MSDIHFNADGSIALPDPNRYLAALLIDHLMRPASYEAVIRRQGAEVYKPMLHFVRLEDERYWNAVRVFGKPDFIHRFWDQRAKDEVAPGDVVIFAKGDDTQAVTPFAYDDSAFF